MKRIKDIITEDVKQHVQDGTCTKSEACDMALRRLTDYRTQVAVLTALTWPTKSAVYKDLFGGQDA